jgi:hypothetical protein
MRGGILAKLPGVLALIVLAAGAVLFGMRDTIRLGGESFVYGFPLVVMDVTRENFTATLGAPNAPHHAREFPDSNFRNIVRPNVDTLYSVAWIDLADGPRIFEVPGTDRYYVMQFLDGWTNVFASIGPRTTGTAPGTFMIVGPDWNGPAPPSTTVLRSPTRIAWLLGRIQTNGKDDYPFVHALQDQFLLLSVEEWRTTRAHDPGDWRKAARPQEAPLYQMRAMTARQFFGRLAGLLVDNPPADADGPAVAKLLRIGVQAGEPLPEWSWLQRQALHLGMIVAERSMRDAVEKPPDLHLGWLQPPPAIGKYGDDYPLRAVVAMAGLGANLPEDAVYPNARADSSGQPLDGSHRYRLHFAKGALPPVRAFWSITAYDSDGYLVANPLGRYALGDRDRLRFNDDGSLDIYIQADPPAEAQRSNWLPTPEQGPFSVTARLYWPEASILERKWQMPGLERLD